MVHVVIVVVGGILYFVSVWWGTVLRSSSLAPLVFSTKDGTDLWLLDVMSVRTHRAVVMRALLTYVRKRS